MNDDDLNLNNDNDFGNFNSPGGSTSGGRGHEVHDDSLSEAETAEDRAFNKRMKGFMEKILKPYFETTLPELVRKTVEEELKKRNL